MGVTTVLLYREALPSLTVLSRPGASVGASSAHADGQRRSHSLGFRVYFAFCCGVTWSFELWLFSLTIRNPVNATSSCKGSCRIRRGYIASACEAEVFLLAKGLGLRAYTGIVLISPCRTPEWAHATVWIPL